MGLRKFVLAATAAALLVSACSSGAAAAPSVSTVGASDITATTATLNGTVESPLVAYYHVEYGTTTSYGSSAPDPEAEEDPFVCTSAASSASPDFVPPWFRCAGAESAHGSVGVALSSLLPGTTYHARLVAHDTDGTAYGNDATFTTAPPGPAPVDVAPPTLSGRALVGGWLTCDPGRWDGAPTFAFGWLRNGVAIPAVTDASYQPDAADAGTQIACRVTAAVFGDADGTAQTAAVRIAHEPLHVALITRSAAVGRNGTTHVGVSCLDVFERCRAALTLSISGRRGHRPSTVARAVVVLEPGGTGRVALTLSRGARHLLAAAPHRRLAVSATLGAATHALVLTS